MLQQQKYKDILAVAENIVVWHMCGNDPKSKYEDVLEFYRFQVTLAKNEDKHNFILTEDISVPVLADRVGLSLYHFIRSFKKETGFTPHDYIIHTRINTAKYLLKNT